MSQPDLIEIRVLFFASAQDRAGTHTSSLTLPAGATLDVARSELERAFPRLTAMLDSCRFAVDQEFADNSTVLRTGSELAVLPPVSGG